MKKKDENRITLSKIMKTKQNNIKEIINPKRNSDIFKTKKLKVKKKFLVKNISLLNINNKDKDILNKLKDNNTNYSKSVYNKLTTYNNKMNSLLNTSDIINRAEIVAINLKKSLIDSDKKHMINIKKFETLRKQTNKINKIYTFLKLKEKRENSKNSFINISKDSNEEDNFKIKNVLKDNILLLTKRKELDSYYIHKSKSQILKDNDKIRFFNKLNEYLEIMKIKSNNLMDNKEKIIKIKNSKYNINYPKLLRKENIKNKKILLQKIKKDNDISLKSIRDTNSTLFTITNNKSFLDEEIELKYKHIYNTNKNQKLNESLHKSNISDEINNNDSFKDDIFHILRINKLEEKKGFISQNSLNKFELSDYFSKKIKNSVENKNDNNIIKSKMESLYDEIKGDNILNKNNREYIENYFKNKKFILNNKPQQLMFVVNNSLNNFNSYNIYKKSKKLYGFYFPHNIQKNLEDLDNIDKSANKIKSRLINSMCQLRVGEEKDK